MAPGAVATFPHHDVEWFSSLDFNIFKITRIETIDNRHLYEYINNYIISWCIVIHFVPSILFYLIMLNYFSFTFL